MSMHDGLNCHMDSITLCKQIDIHVIHWSWMKYNIEYWISSNFGSKLLFIGIHFNQFIIMWMWTQFHKCDIRLFRWLTAIIYKSRTVRHNWMKYFADKEKLQHLNEFWKKNKDKECCHCSTKWNLLRQFVAVKIWIRDSVNGMSGKRRLKILRKQVSFLDNWAK